MKTAAIPSICSPRNGSAHLEEAAIAERLAAAELYCQARDQRFTEHRKEVLKLLLQNGGCVKAYELLGELKRTHPHAGPPAIYRPLHFLVTHGLAHRVESLNAYVACSSPVHHDLLVVCPRCTAVVELADDGVSTLLKNRLQHSGFVLQDSAVEINALCATCADVRSDNSSGHTPHPF